MEEESTNRETEDQQIPCMDNLFCLKQKNEKTISAGKDLHLSFIDLTKAFDNEPFKMLWKTFENVNMNNTIMKAIEQLYKDSITKADKRTCINGIYCNQRP